MSSVTGEGKNLKSTIGLGKMESAVCEQQRQERTREVEWGADKINAGSPGGIAFERKKL